ncbi:MAG: sugar ABC transporter ATP-binding protein [Candidatus Cloacimonetes bacterium]|nr:sugar ABC transporter ATP-binding protein [Candidatus Cloacimonadota bacterium]
MSVLRTENITKVYPGTAALDNVSVSFDSGKVHALIGKNGSGKSTLVKVFSGAIQPTSGKFFLNDAEMHFEAPTDAFSKGIATVYQELSLVPYLSVAENIFLGRLPKKRKVIDWKKTYAMAKEMLDGMNVDIDPHEKVFKLSMWQCQVVEITKAMSFNPKVLMLDEPTSALANNETQRLFEVIRQLKKKDVIIIYISHRLQELWEIADTVTVFRDGKYVGNGEIAQLSHKDIIRMMFGDVKINTRPKDLMAQNEVIMEVKGLTRKGKFEDVSFKLRKGEILGIAGMLGAGRTELLRSIFGADSFDSGSIIIDGQKSYKKSDTVHMKSLGMGLTPEERKTQGIILIHSIRDNLCYSCLDRISNRHVIDNKKRIQLANKQVDELEIKISGINANANSLSGGNQQKVVIGNWLNNEPKIMMYDEPTRGIDVQAKQQIFNIMWDQSRSGISSIFVSSELEELLEVCHRILIMYQGRVIGEVNPDNMTIDELYAICMGGIINED